MSRLYLTVDELVGYLKHSGLLTVLVEGSDEQRVYRYIENRLGDLGIDVLPCGGRDCLLGVYLRRDEFKSTHVIFVADQDMWYFTGIPSQYCGSIVFTKGYSIENDLYVGEVFESLMSPMEKVRFEKLLSQLARWQAFHVEVFSRLGYCNCDYHLSRILPMDDLCADHLRSIGFIEPEASSVERIRDSFSEALRGKTLFQLLLRILSSKTRPSKYSRDNLIELGAKLSNPTLESLCNRIRLASEAEST